MRIVFARMRVSLTFFRRGLNPPHRVKSINMSTFTQDEVEFMRTHGNQVSLDCSPHRADIRLIFSLVE